MFETLSDRLNATFQRMSSKGRLDEADVDEALKEVRRALLESDVNFKVVKDFVGRVREKAIGQDVMRSLTPAQMVVKIVHDELIDLLGEAVPLGRAKQAPTIYMLVGLQGSGKTTTVAKLGLQLKRNNLSPLLVAADVYRPAAIHQLETLGKQLNIPVYSEGTKANPVNIAQNALNRAAELRSQTIILDTAGRLHIDETMMGELVQIKERVQPTEVLLVVDAMTGQDAVRVAETFNEQVGITGVVLTKVDGDARGGAALSVRTVTGVPIKLMGTGEKTDALEPFFPDRLASRILGMGDVMTLIERAQSEYDMDQAKAMEKKLRTATFDLDDFLNQLQMVKRLGPLQQVMEMIPGMGAAMRQSDVTVQEDDLKHIEAIIRSMTPKERHQPQIIDSSRRRRIAHGSGVTTQEVNMLLNQFKQMQKMMKQLGGWDGKGKPPRNLRGLMNMFR
ncbi:MAG TPA: signal recognition particle protein [Chloroflexia bacterium]|jgi:signal recognition particle subunit SRP54|nr:signal recognition particle protein [Chloroflexia bacterium]